MTMHNYSIIPSRLAAALLLKHGEISFGEIRALPLVDDEQAVLAIADLLAHKYEVTRLGRWEIGAPPTRFEDVIRLIGPTERSPVARLVPVAADDGERAEQAANRIRSRRRRLKGAPLAELVATIHEGHRH